MKGGEKRSEGGGGSRDHVVGRGLEPVCSIHVPVDGPRRTAATFRFARFLFSSPSSFLPADPSPSSESRGEPVRARAGEEEHLLFFALHPFSPSPPCLSSCPSARFVGALFLLLSRLFVVGVFFDGCLRAALFQTRKIRPAPAKINWRRVLGEAEEIL